MQRTIPVLCRMFKSALLALAIFASPCAMASELEIAEKSIWTQAFSALKKGDEAAARAFAAHGKNPLLAKAFAHHFFLKTNDSRVWQDIATFIQQNPEWAGLYALRRQVERLMPKNRPPAEVVAWFENYPPLSMEGILLDAAALESLGRPKEAGRIVRRFFPTRGLPVSRQKEYVRLYGRFLQEKDYAGRVDALVWRGEYSAAEALLPQLSKSRKALMSARIALALRRKDASALVRKVPAELVGDPGLAYERLRWRRREGMIQSAIDFLPHVHMGSHAEDFWNERHLLAREAIEGKRWATAARILSGHGLVSGANWAQAEWLQGWIALRGLDKPEEAIRHFERLHEGVSTPQSLSRAAYWAGRADEASGNGARAVVWYRKAAIWPTTYYGQMAIARLGGKLEDELRQAAVRPGVDATAFQSRELVATLRLLHEVGAETDVMSFVNKMLEHVENPYEYNLFAEMCYGLGKPGAAVRVARDGAVRTGVQLVPQGYPRLAGVTTPASSFLSLVHGVIRQESGFDQDARSPAGARGLMQLMPATARQVAGKLGIAARDDAATNLRIGSTYLKNMMEDFDGSAVLALAAYNAGPTRAREWVKRFGDPREQGVDVVDWVEKLPMGETRNYIQRVLENAQVYEVLLNH